MDSHERHRHLSMSYHPMCFHDAGVYLLQEYLTHGLYRIGVQALIQYKSAYSRVENSYQR